jgi:hypothetical protein
MKGAEERRLRRIDNTPQTCQMSYLSAGIVVDESLMVDQATTPAMKNE